MASITIIYPNGGEELAKSSTYNITWSGVDIYPHPKIELYKGGLFNQQIAYSSPTENLYSWTIPSTLTIGTDYKIKISACSGTSTGCYTSPTYPTDMSNGNFSIVDSITCSIPIVDFVINKI